MPIRRAAENDPKRCENCFFFYQHYYIPKFGTPEYRRCDCGHCFGKRRRTVKPGYVCERFAPRDTTSNE